MNNADVLDLRWHGKLPDNYGQVFDEIAYLIRKEFIELIEQVSSSMNNNLDWWVEGPASRNYFSSPLFHYCCSLVLLDKLASQKNLSRLILVDSKAFYALVKSWSRDNNLNLEVHLLSRIDESLIKKYFGSMLSGAGDSSQLGGPIRIAKITGQVAEFGIVPFLSIMAYISISLGLINLFPIPLLDGGHLMFYTFEKILGHPLSQKIQEGFFRIGMFLLLFIMFFATYNDLKDLGLF